MANTEDLKSSELKALVGSSPTSGTKLTMGEYLMTYCDYCRHPYDNHDDKEGCKDCHKHKEECLNWIKFREYISERDL